MNINVYLSDKDPADLRLVEALRRETQRQDRSISHLMRTALHNYLQTMDEGHPQITT